MCLPHTGGHWFCLFHYFRLVIQNFVSDRLTIPLGLGRLLLPLFTINSGRLWDFVPKASHFSKRLLVSVLRERYFSFLRVLCDSGFLSVFNSFSLSGVYSRSIFLSGHQHSIQDFYSQFQGSVRRTNHLADLPGRKVNLQLPGGGHGELSCCSTCQK